jgi:acylphosphatase
VAGERVALRALVHGRVQGVGYRFFVVDNAARLGLSGYARNLPDARSVEVVAEGDRTSLEALLAQLREGPSGSHVERVDASWSEPAGGFSGFGVR